ncbi:MAG TPA: hypothetical protein VG055_33560 [Planctomycetaceae bacterium]|jgi:hypothetical protein|nr:hypothetical protein [Planctomycetaceae bacterium]
MNFDFARICDLIEILSDLTTDQAWGVLRELRRQTQALSEAHGDIDPKNIEKVGTLIPIGPDDEDYLRLVEALPDLRSRAMLTLPRVLRTPRLLKVCSRQTQDAWQRLHGEVDFDDLLICQVIRSLSTTAFSFLVRNYRHFCIVSEAKEPRRGSTAEDSEANAAALKTAWNEELKDESGELRADLWTLLSFAFPGLEKGMDLRQARPPQGISIATYWARVSRQSAEPSVPDQRVLQDILSWKEGTTPNALPKQLKNDKAYAETFERLQDAGLGLRSDLRLGTHELRALASTLFDIAMAEERAEASMTGVHERLEGTASIVIWQLFIGRHVSSAGDDRHREWVSAEVRKAMPVSLRLALDIAYYWGTSRQSRMLTPQDAIALYSEMADIAKKEWDAAKLCASLGHYTYSLSQFVTGGHESELQGNWPVDWGWLGRILVDALKQCPVTIVPQICHLLSPGETRLGTPPSGGVPTLVRTHTLNRETLGAITKPDYQGEFLQTLVNQIPLALANDLVSNEDKTAIASVRDGAQIMLSGEIAGS